MKNIAISFLYDQDEYVIWSNNGVYIYGVQDLITINGYNIELRLIKNSIQIKGNNLKIIKSSEKEISIQGDIHEIIK